MQSLTDIALRDTTKTLQGVTLIQLVSDITHRFNDLDSNFKDSWDETLTNRYETLKSLIDAPFKDKKSVDDEKYLYPDLDKERPSNPSIDDRYKPIEKLAKMRRTNIYAPIEKEFGCTTCSII